MENKTIQLDMFRQEYGVIRAKKIIEKAESKNEICINGTKRVLTWKKNQNNINLNMKMMKKDSVQNLIIAKQRSNFKSTAGVYQLEWKQCPKKSIVNTSRDLKKKYI